MGTPYLAEIRLISFNYAPKGWAFCNGQLLPINQNQALFALLGTTYGGNGITNFQLPNLQGRMPRHFGNGVVLGETAGEQAVSLTPAQMPAHTHPVQASNTTAAIANPAGARPAQASTANFAPSADLVPLSAHAFSAAGGGQPHDNMPPYLVVNYVIALVGIFPSRN